MTNPDGSIDVYAYDNMDRIKLAYSKDNINAAPILVEGHNYDNGYGGNPRHRYQRYAYPASVTDSRYDYAGRCVSESKSDNESYTAFTYNPNGTLASKTDPNGYATYYSYDGLNREVKSWSPVSTSQYSYSETQYDRNGNILKSLYSKALVTNGGVPSALEWEGYKYDQLNRMTEQSDSLGGKTTWEYDDVSDSVEKKVYMSASKYSGQISKYNYLGLVTEEAITGIDSGDLINGETSITTSMEYDSMGNLLSKETPDGVVTSFSYDLLGRQLTVSKPFVNEYGAAVDITIEKAYDYAGNLISSKDGNGNETKYEYDKIGNLKKTTDAKGGATFNHYDNANNIYAVILAKNYTSGLDSATTLTGTGITRDAYFYNAIGQTYMEIDYYRNETGAGVSRLKNFKYDNNGNLTQESMLDRYTRYTYDGQNRVATVLNAVSAAAGKTYSEKYSYDGRGRIVEKRDGNDILTAYTYNDRGDMLTIQISGELKEQNTYDLIGHVLTKKDGNGNVTSYAYNSLGQLKSMTLPQDGNVPSITVAYKYDVLGYLAKEEDSTGRVVAYDYNNRGDLVSSTEMRSDSTEAITTARKYDKAGNLRFYFDGNGNKTEYIYDELNRVVSEKREVTVNGSLVTQTKTYGFDMNGNKVSATDPFGNQYAFAYDDLNRLSEKRDPDNTLIEKLKYDDFDEQTQSIDALGNIVTFEYNNNGGLIKTTDASGKTNKKAYDLAGNVISQTDGNNNVTAFTYTKENLLASVTTPLGETSYYAYDIAGNLISQKDASGNITTYKYNCRNLPLKRVDPLGIKPDGSTDPGRTESYEYNADGRVSKKIDRNGVTTLYTYDIHGRALTENAGGDIVSHAYDNNGNELAMTDSTGTTIRAYDELNRTISKTVPDIGAAVFAYDQTAGQPAGFVAEVSTDPKGNTVKKVTDKAGRLSKVIDGNETTAYEYYANGNRKSVNYPGGASEEYTYYPNGQLNTLANKDGSKIIEAYSYGYDNAGNMASKKDGKGITSYAYDELNRLYAISEPSGEKTAYSYSPNGNRTKEAVVNSAIESATYYAYDERGRLISTRESERNIWTGSTVNKGGTDFTYDANGNMLSRMSYKVTGEPSTESVVGIFPAGEENADDGFSKEAAIYEYDSRNNMVKAVQGGAAVISEYNGYGLRVSKASGGKTSHFLYEYDKIVLETDDNGNQAARNVYGLNLLKRTDSGESCYYMYNGHGDVTALLKPNGTVAAGYYYDAFGVIIEQSGSVNNPYRYAGYEYDEESGLYYLKSRFYSASLARFMQEDTYRGRINDPLSLNLYSYANNNPVRYYDPTGHAPVVITPSNKFGANTVQTGVIKDNVTYVNGKRPGDGAVVFIDNKAFVMQGGKGGAFESNANIVVNGRITGSGYIINGVTYDQYGNRPPNNAIITDKKGKEIGRMPGAPPAPQPPKESNNMGAGNNTNNSAPDNNPANNISNTKPIPTAPQVDLPHTFKDQNLEKDGANDKREVIRIQSWLGTLTSPTTKSLYLDPFATNQHEKSDGGFGTSTKKAVVQFQKDNHLIRTDGVVDKETWDAIQTAYYLNATYTDQTVKMGKPIDNIDVSNMSDPYGYRVTNIKGATKNHQGVDFKSGGVDNPPVSSMIAGTVVITNLIKLRGNTVLIRSTDNPHIYVLLQHLDTIYVNVGDTVIRGQQIGIMGSTGDGSGIHLHIEVLIDPTYSADSVSSPGHSMNPWLFLP